MRKRQGILICFLVMFLFLCTWPLRADAALPVVSEQTPMYASGWRKASYRVYRESSLTNRVETLSYRRCKIIRIQDNAVLISYQSGGSSKTGWIALSRFVYNPDYQHQIAYANTAVRIHRRPSASAPAVTVRLHSGGIEVGERGSWKQVLFKSGNKYQLGWMPKGSFTSYVRLSMDATTQVLADGVYTFTPRDSKNALTYDQSSNGFRFEKNTSSGAQRFKLRHIGRDYYVITPQNASGNMALGNGLTVKTGDDNRWLLRRKGAYFYIIDSSSRLISGASGRLQVLPLQKVAANQWQVRKVSATPTLEDTVVFSQFDPRWGGSTYYKGKIKRTISTSGCGVVALTNAIYALNGEFIHPTKIAKFSAERGHYVYMAGTDDTLYKEFAKKQGKTYHFKHSGKVYSLTKLKNHLRKGGTAIALVPGHYIAITAYRAKDNKYLVLDSAVYAKRPTSIHGDWISGSSLKRQHLKCEYFHLFSRR